MNKLLRNLVDYTLRTGSDDDIADLVYLLMDCLEEAYDPLPELQPRRQRRFRFNLGGT